MAREPAARQNVTTGGEGGSRRNFAVELSSILIGAVLGLIPACVGLFAFLDPLRRQRPKPTAYRAGSGGPEGYTRITSLASLPVGGTPQRFPVISDQRDAWNFIPQQPIGAVFVARTAPEEVRVFNATCPHAGCSVSCDGSAFNCPCHNSAFNLDGSKRVSQSGRENPSPRPLDSLAVDAQMLAQGEIWVEFVNFYTGIAEKKPKV
jgi:Rieske Fe-S protein